MVPRNSIPENSRKICYDFVDPAGPGELAGSGTLYVLTPNPPTPTGNINAYTNASTNTMLRGCELLS